LTLRSKAEFGIPDPQIAERFRGGVFQITQADPNEVFWHLFRGELRPVIFEHDETSRSNPTPVPDFPGSLKTYRTCDLWRKEFQKTDRRWLEIPLFHGNAKIGLLSLDLPARVTAVEYETLQWACNCISLVLHAAQQSLDSSRDAEGQGLLEGAKSAAAMATHQLANLFGPIETACHYLKEDLTQLQLASPQVESLLDSATLIEKCIHRARGILQDFSRYGRNNSLSDVRSTPLKPLLHQIVQGLRDRWRDICFELRFSSLTQDVEIPLVTVSRSGLQEVFEILASNSDRHGRTDPNHLLKVDIGLESTPVSVRVFFHDNGVGVTKTNRSQLFTPFFTTHAEGTGLGLQIALNLMRRMRGNLSLSHHDQSGACFCLELVLATQTEINPPSGEENV
jgi:signal transduction histidine kinase